MLATSPKLMCFMTCVQWKWNIYNQQEKSQIHDCCPRGESWGDQGKLWSTGETRPRPGNRPIHECPRGDIPKKDHHKQRHGGRTVCGLTECVTRMDQGVQTTGGNWGVGRSISVSRMDSFGSCKWTISLSILVRAWGSSPSPRMLLSQLGFRGHFAGPT